MGAAMGADWCWPRVTEVICDGSAAWAAPAPSGNSEEATSAATAKQNFPTPAIPRISHSLLAAGCGRRRAANILANILPRIQGEAAGTTQHLWASAPAHPW